MTKMVLLLTLLLSTFSTPEMSWAKSQHKQGKNTHVLTQQRVAPPLPVHKPSWSSLAQNKEPNSESETEAGQCVNCPPPSESKSFSESLLQAASVMQNVQEHFKVSQYKLPKIGVLFNEHCQNFIGSQGQLGPWGEKVLSSIEKINSKCFYGDMKTSRLCPRYKHFSPTEKKYFWVWVFASIAQEESSCNLAAPSIRGAYGRTDGLFQLEYSFSLRSGSDRDPKWCKTQGPADTDSLDFQVNCAVSIFNDVNCQQHKGLVYVGGYWQGLTGVREKISRLVRRFPGCLHEQKK